MGADDHAIDAFLGDDPLARELYDVVSRTVTTIGETTVRVTKSQIAFRRRRTFAAVWTPTQYLHRPAAPLVLTVFLPARDPSPRWKQVVEPSPGRFTHHLELWRVADVDKEVAGWLRQAWDHAA